jgi:hypothetical protein
VWNNPLKYVDPSGYKVGGNGPGFAHWWYIQMLKIKRATYEIWDDPFDDPLSSGGDFYDYGTSGGGAGGGAPLGGSAASGPGTGGGGCGAAPLNLGGDGVNRDDHNNEQNGNNTPPRLINNSGKVIWFKPDDDYIDSDGRVYKANDSYPIIPGHYTSVPVDGFTIGGNVYKVTDGYNIVIINSDGSYFVDYSYPWYALYNQFNGGLLESSPDSGWDDLFQKVKN